MKKNLCFTYHKPEHQNFECPSSKKWTTSTELEQVDDDVSNGESNNEVVPTTSIAIIIIEVEQDSTMLQNYQRISKFFFVFNDSY